VYSIGGGYGKGLGDEGGDGVLFCQSIKPTFSVPKQHPNGRFFYQQVHKIPSS
jgi:hypothetical protein